MSRFTLSRFTPSGIPIPPSSITPLVPTSSTSSTSPASPAVPVSQPAARRHRRRHPKGQVGLTLVETIISFLVLTLALTGVMQLLLVGSRMNHFAHRMGLASAVAHDLLENMSLWDYDDPRLVPKATLITQDGEQAVDDFEFGREEAVSGSARPHYGERDDGIAETPAALATDTSTYRGVSLTDNDSLPELSRYWNVYALDPDGDGLEEGKLILVGVRWLEPGVGYRHVTASSFLGNERVFAQ